MGAHQQCDAAACCPLRPAPQVPDIQAEYERLSFTCFKASAAGSWAMLEATKQQAA